VPQAEPAPAVNSPNFYFLVSHDPLLVTLAAQAETYLFFDPNTSLLKLRNLSMTLRHVPCELSVALINSLPAVAD
jgi:hypothetical protein